MKHPYDGWLNDGVEYKCGVCGWHLRAELIAERGVTVGWFLFNLDDPSQSLWVTPVGALFYAAYYNSDNLPKFTAEPLYIQRPGWEPEVATLDDLEWWPEPDKARPLLPGGPTVIGLDDNDVDLDVWGEVLR